MGGAASKQVATKATSAAAKATVQATTTATATAAAAQPARAVQTTLSREQIEKLSTKPTTKGAAADIVRNPNAAPRGPQLMEMNDDLIKEMERFQDFENVQYLEQDTKGFRDTASSYRPRSTDPISMPTDRTANAASGTGMVDKIEGRLSNRDFRFLLRLHYEDPEKWDTKALADHFSVDPAALKNVLDHVGPPNVLKPLGPLEHPLGIWFTSPAEAAAQLVSSEAERRALPSSSTSPPP